MTNKIQNESILLKEIEVIQDIIKRMAKNSFLIKGWTVTLVVATLLLETKDYMVLIAFIPLIVFWILDAYFLHQERLFRKLYEWVIVNRLESEENLLDMNTERFKDKVDGIPKTMISLTLLLFYGSIFFLIVIYSITITIIQTASYTP